jgi:hypothetical protein
MHTDIRRQHLGERLGIGEVLLVAVSRHALHPIEVGAGAERRAMSGEHHDADGWIVLNIEEGAAQLCDESIVKSVAHLGTVERHAGNSALLGYFKHGSTITSVLTEFAIKHFSWARR